MAMTYNRYAILIGNSQFMDPRLESLRCPDNDVDEFGDILSSKIFCNFDDVSILKNKTKNEVEQKLEEIIGKTCKDDLVLIYYSGHGKQRNGKLFLVSSDTKDDYLVSTSVSIEFIRNLLGPSKANKVILILDCCYSGLAGKDLTRNSISDQLNSFSEASGICILTASTSVQESWERESEMHGVFTRHIIEGIKSGKAVNKDGNITVDSLYSYIYDKMRNDGSQTPMKWEAQVKGELLISSCTDKNESRYNMNIKDRIFFKFDEIIPRDTIWVDEGPWTLDAKPSQGDFLCNRIAIPDEVLYGIKKSIENNHFALIIGDKDCGKTWLSYILGYIILSDKAKTSDLRENRIYYAQVNNRFSADDAIQELQELRDTCVPGNKFEPETYIFLDDCHLAPIEVVNLIDKILNDEDENLRTIILTRRDQFLLQELNDSYKANKNSILAAFDLAKRINYEQYNKKIFAKYIESKDINREIDEQDIEEAARNWGSDLFWNWLRLKSWNYKNNDKLSSIGLDRVIRDLRRNDGEIKLDNPKRRKILQFLSFFCQFERFYVYKLINFLEVEENYKTLAELIEEKLVIEYVTKPNSYPYVYLSQNLAELILLASGIKHNTKLIKDEVTAIKSYITSESEPPNRFGVIVCLNSAIITEDSPNAKKIFSALINDKNTFDYIESNIIQFSIQTVLLLIQAILLVENKQSWSESEKARRIHARLESSDFLKSKFPTARKTRSNIRSLAHIVDLEMFFSKFDEIDYIRIINNSDVNALRLLFFDIIMFKLPHFGEKLADALLKFDLKELLGNDTCNLFRLGGLIGNIAQVKISLAAEFVEKLSNYDLSDLFLHGDYKGEGKDFSRIQSINLFLTKRATYSEKAGRDIIDSIGSDVWTKIFEESKSDNEKFYLLWNIYVPSPVMAAEIIRRGFGSFLLDESPKNVNNRYFLPMLGIYYLCNMPIGETDLYCHLDIIRGNFQMAIRNSELNIVILYLISIKFLFKSDVYEQFIKNLNAKMISYIKGSKRNFAKNLLLSSELDEIIVGINEANSNMADKLT